MRQRTRASFRVIGIGLTAAALAALPVRPVLHAQPAAEAAAQPRRSYDIPPGPLAGALNRFADEAGLALVYRSSLAEGLSTAGLSGAFSPREALDRLLAGTGLTYRMTGATTVTIEKAPTEGERTLGPVEVEGVRTVAAGANGSTDPTATEGTGSLTSDSATVTSKYPMSLKETPQSVTVMTLERFQQQNFTDLASALAYTPGLTTTSQDGSAGTASFSSRGFQLGTIRFDGGAPLVMHTNGAFNSYYETTPDLAEMDHIEVLRGSDSLFGGAGLPGGIVSLERKRPLDHNQLTLDGEIGSWNNKRIVADATGPLGLDGALRGRMVMEYQDRHFFYDVAHRDKTFIYGVLEADLPWDTLLRVGGSYERQNNQGQSFGVPFYINGRDLGLPVSTCLCAPWNHWNFWTTEIFASLEHRFSDDWNLKLNAMRLNQKSDKWYAAVYNPINPDGSGLEFQENDHGRLRSTQYAFDLTLTGAFALFGLKQQLAVGADYQRDNSVYSIHNAFVNTPISVFSFNPTQLNPQPPEPPLAYYGNPIRQEQWAGYASLNLQPLKGLHLLGGGRLSVYRYNELDNYYGVYASISPDPSGHDYYTDKDYGVFTPYFGLTYDLTSDLTLYASYAAIYQSQSMDLGTSNNSLRPVTGPTYEVGVKAAPEGEALNASAALYYTEENNLAVALPGTPAVQGLSCCYRDDGAVTSKGIDLEISGRILPGWQVQAGYNFNINSYNQAFLNAGFGNNGSVYTPLQPKHQIKFWTTYTLPGAWDQWTVGGGFRIDSSRFVASSICSVAYTPSGGCPSNVYVPYNITLPLYSVVDLHVEYRLDNHWKAALNVTNLGDTRYYTTISSPAWYNFYGEPRAVTFSLHGKY